MLRENTIPRKPSNSCRPKRLLSLEELDNASLYILRLAQRALPDNENAPAKPREITNIPAIALDV